MTLEADLFTALKSLVGNRVAPDFPQPPNLRTWPAIRYTIVSNVPVQDLCGDGDDSTATPTVQLDCVAETFAAARSLRLQVMAAMRSFSPPARLENSHGYRDYEEKVRYEILEYSFHGSS